MCVVFGDRRLDRCISSFKNASKRGTHSTGFCWQSSLNGDRRPDRTRLHRAHCGGNFTSNHLQLLVIFRLSDRFLVTSRPFSDRWFLGRFPTECLRLQDGISSQRPLDRSIGIQRMQVVQKRRSWPAFYSVLHNSGLLLGLFCPKQCTFERGHDSRFGTTLTIPANLLQLKKRENDVQFP